MAVKICKSEIDHEKSAVQTHKTVILEQSKISLQQETRWLERVEVQHDINTFSPTQLVYVEQLLNRTLEYALAQWLKYFPKFSLIWRQIWLPNILNSIKSWN